MEGLYKQSAGELAAAIRNRKVTSRALLDYFLARIERLNPGINAVIEMNIQAARERADAADAALAAGENWGPLHGVPMTVKDTYEVAGMTAVVGAPALKNHRPKTNAVAAQRLLDAGAIIFGKTNTPLFAQDLQSFNAVYGTTNNPWDTSRTPGGSSGGAAAALAAGLTPLELGSDIGGSIRTPAHFCGVYGHKPTHGIIPMRGHIPGPPGTLSEPDLAVAGPLTRNPADLALALAILAGAHGHAAKGWQLELPEPRHTSLQDFRVACWFDDPACPVGKDTTQALQNVAEQLRTAGVQVDEQAKMPVAAAESFALYDRLLNAVIGAGLPPKAYNGLRRIAPLLRLIPGASKSKLASFAAAATQRHRDWARSNERRQRERAAWEEFFQHYDVLLMPVNITPAFKHNHAPNLFKRKLEVDGIQRSYFEQFMWIGPPTSALLPVTTAPIGVTPHGLPIGMQIVGAYLEDKTTIEFARLLDNITGGCKTPPGYGEDDGA